MILATVRDLRAADLCHRGARDWFRAQGLSWHEFLARGLPVETLDATGCALARRVTAEARARAAREGDHAET
ncbi:MAG: hypothetical protein Tsb0020_48190 [Haliangiales bacterium]